MGNMSKRLEADTPENLDRIILRTIELRGLQRMLRGHHDEVQDGPRIEEDRRVYHALAPMRRRPRRNHPWLGGEDARIKEASRYAGK